MRVNAYIDGFNLYHAICCDGHPELRKYRWCNYRKLVEMFLHPADELHKVYYFTALAKWDERKVQRHLKLLAALQGEGVEIVPGNFQLVTKNCNECRKSYETYEEKRTDVNIAVHLIEHAVQDQYDKALIVSGDSDLVPGIECVNRLFPKKRLEAVLPPNANAQDIRDSVYRAAQIKERHLLDSQFPEEVKWKHPNGKDYTAKKPPEWD